MPKLHNNSLHGAGRHSGDHLSDSSTQCGLNTATVTKSLKREARHQAKNVIRAKHSHNVLTKVNITDQENWMRESASADVILAAS